MQFIVHSSVRNKRKNSSDTFVAFLLLAGIEKRYFVLQNLLPQSVDSFLEIKVNIDIRLLLLRSSS